MAGRLSGMAVDLEPTESRNAGTLLERLRAARLTTVDEVYEVNGTPHPMIVEKHTNYVTPLIEDFIANGPWYP